MSGGTRQRLVAVLTSLGLLTSLLPGVITGADTALAAIDDTRCVVETATSTGTQSGVTAVAVGEQLRVGTEVDLAAGVVYQDILANPDGSTYVASWIGVAQAAGGTLVADLSSLSLTIGGVAQTLQPGFAPTAGGFVLDSSGPMLKVYFPGDPAVMADPTGSGTPSYTVPDGGQTARFTYVATVPDLAGGEVTPAVACQAAISYGDENAAVNARGASVAVLGLDAQVAKSANVPVLAPSTTVTYLVTVSVPNFDPSGEIRNGSAFDTVVTDTLPSGLDYVAGSASNGGVESGGVISWTIDGIAAGSSVTLTYQVAVPANAPIGATFTNNVTAVTTSQPGSVSAESTSTVAADSVSLTNGATAPGIAKSSNVTVAGTGQLVTYQVAMTWPAGSTWHDVTITDLLPNGVTLVNPATSFVCASTACPTFTTLAPFVDTAGNTRFGRYVTQLGPFATTQTWTWTYTARMVGSYTDGAPVPLGTPLDNLAEVRFNLIPRLGGAVPSPAHLNEYDGLVGDAAPVTFNRPVIAIDKAGPAPAPVQLTPAGVTYTVTLTNTGGVNATNVTFTDAGPISGARLLGSIDPASVAGATFNSGTGTFTVALVPAGGNTSVTYRVIGSPSHPVTVDAEYANTATLTGYRDPSGNVYEANLPDVAEVTVDQPVLSLDKQRLSASPIAGTDGETIDYRVTVTNTGTTTAYDVSGTDAFAFDGTRTIVSCTGMTMNAAGAFTIAQLAPSSTAACDYEVELGSDQPEGALVNTATMTWENGFGQTGTWDDVAGDVQPWTASDAVTTTVIHPRLALQKTPDADTIGNAIPNGGTAVYTITITNVGAVTARQISVADLLPDGLTLEAEPTLSSTPPGIGNTVTGGAGDGDFQVSIPALEPGHLMRINVPVRHDGVAPADDQLVNTATVTASGIPTPLNDTGVLQWVPAVFMPVADKTVTPASSGIGEQVTWTVTATIRENNVDLYDVAFVDSLPRGLLFDAYGDVSCVSGPLCATAPSPTPLAASVLSTGETRIGWFVGDVAGTGGTSDTTYTFTFTATVATAYTGTGVPAAGTEVTDTTLHNRVQPWLTLTPARDTYNDGSLPNLASASLNTQFERRGAAATEPLRIVTPKVVAAKQPTNLGDQFEWDTDDASGAGWMASAGDEIAYAVTFTNTGGATAHDVRITDSMGRMPSGTTMLRDVEVTGLPPGVTVLDGWTLADPDVEFHIDELGPSDSVTVTYTGVVAPSAELVPGFSGDNRDIALIDNTLTIAEFRSAPAGGGLLFDSPVTTSAEVYVYTPSAHIHSASACIGNSTAPAGTTGTFSLTTRNGAPPFGEITGTLLTTGFPPDPTVGVAHDTSLTVVLSPNVRFVPGTARSGISPLLDPTSSLDAATSVQTLVFDLGDLAPGASRPVAFDVRTTAFGVQGGMTATLAMDDASGSPSRGTAVPGAAYTYRQSQSRGCAPAEPLRVTKVPDQSYQYDGKKLFKVGEPVTWSGGVSGSGAPYHDGEFVDTMPDGISYTPGSAVFVVRRMDNTAVIARASNGNMAEVVTALPDGRTELRFTSPSFAEFRSMTYSMNSVVDSDAIVGGTLTNVIDLFVSDGVTASCANPLAAACDNGQVRILSSAEPSLTKSVDHSVGPWGDTFAYTVDVTLPANTPFFDAFIGDRGDYPRALDAATPFAGATITCLSGCTLDPTPVMLPVYRQTGAGADELASAWFLGDLTAGLTERVYRITYGQTFVDVAEHLAEFGVDPLSEEYVNQAIVGWNDANVLIDANYQPAGPAHTAGSSHAFAFDGMARATDDAAVNLVRPELGLTKQCQALPGRDDPASSTSTGGESTGSIPNFRCVLTATNTTDASLGTTIVDPVFVDTLPATSNPGGRPITTQVISTTSAEPLLAVDVTEVPASPLSPPAAQSITLTGLGVELAPGESVSVIVDMRVTAANAFWTNATLSAERTSNTVAAESFADTLGNAYEGDSTDSWNLVIAKPQITVSQRAWTEGDYEASLDEPTACMAYALKPEAIGIERFAGNGVIDLCTIMRDARGHDGMLVGGEYARAYVGGAPDVVPGVDDRVTWAVDVAVVSPEANSTVSVTDQIPYGFEYVPGSARVAQWSEEGTTHTPLGDPVVGANPAVTCSSVVNISNGPFAGGEFHVAGRIHGQAPWTPLTWTFANGGSGAAGAFWDDDLAYLNAANRDAAGALATATPFDRMVRVVFEVRPRAEFAACLQTPQRANSFRSQVTATATNTRGAASSVALGWVVGVELARVDKTPDGAISPDGTTATYGIDVTITDPTRLRNVGDGATPGTHAGAGGVTNVFAAICNNTALPAAPTRTPWIGLGDLSRNGTPLTGTFTGTYDADFSSELVVTDTFVDDGQYVPGSATFDMRDPWGRPFTGHLASEDVETITVGGRQASRVTWTFDHYPSPANGARPVGNFPCSTSNELYYTYPSSMHISVPLPIPDGTPDGTTYPNTAQVTTNHLSDGAVVRTQSDSDTAIVTVRNPAPPPPATKTALPDQVAPGATFDWVIEAQLDAGEVWFDLGWTDRIPANMQLLGYGTPSCVVTGTATPCSGPSVNPTRLEPVVNPDGSATVAWFVGDLVGSGNLDRTLRMPVSVRFVGDEVAGDQLTNVAVGFSNESDAVGTPIAPPDPAAFTYRSDPVVGTATVVEPDLSITKTVTNGPGPFQSGELVSYQVIVTNTGGAPAYDVLVVDTPDAFLTSVATTSPQRSKGWTALDPLVEWYLPTVAAGQTVTLDVSGIVASGYLAGGIRQLTNTATVTGFTSRPIDEDNAREYPAQQAAVTVPLVAQNLVVDKYAGADCVDPAQAYAPGNPVEWCVIVANTGDAVAHNVTLTDLLPPGWTYQLSSASVDGSTVEPTVSTTSAGNQRLVWDLGDVAPDVQHVLRYGTAGTGSGSLVTNTAIANSTLADGSPIPNAPDGFRSQGEAYAAALGAGLQIAKLPNQQRIVCDRLLGCELTWQIVVVNADELDLTNTTVTDYLPAGLTLDTATTQPGWTAASVGVAGSGPSSTTPITWEHTGTFGSAGVVTFEVTATVPAGTSERSYLNHAVAVADGVPQVENQALAEVYSTASLGDFVWHDLDRDGVQDPGEPALAGITVQLRDAAGNLVATNATDPGGRYRFGDLQPGRYRLRFVVPEGWATSPAGVGAGGLDSDVGSDGWTQQIDLASGTDDLTWDAGLNQPQEPDPPAPAISIEKTTNGVDADQAAEAPVVNHGSTVTWVYTITNTGNEPLVGIALTDDVEPQVTLDQDHCVRPAGAAWPEPLQPGNTIVCTFTGTADQALYRNVGAVTGVGQQSGTITADDDPSHYREAPVGVPQTVDLALTKTVAAQSGLTAGSVVTYTLTVRNNGPGNAIGPITVTDPMPEGLQPVGSAGDTECTIDGNLVTCVHPDGLAPGATFAVTIDARITGAATGEVVNVASASAANANAEATLDNNTGAAAIVVIGGNLPRTGGNPIQVALVATFLLIWGLTLQAFRRRSDIKR